MDSNRKRRNSPQDLESTAALLARLRQGDESAGDRLFSRYLPLFKRWARGRLPRAARGLAETDDLVQMTLLSALGHLDGFEPRREGALLAYLRQILKNKVRDEIRRVARQPRPEELSENVQGDDPSPLDDLVEAETFEAYEAALETLPAKTREAVIMRLELGLTYQEIAEAVESPSANAVRMTISRGLVQLSERMRGVKTE